MKARISLCPLMVIALALQWTAAPAQAAPAKAPKPSAAAAPNAPSAAAEVEIPQSVFVIPATPKEGRNPFFPRSAMAQPAPLPGKQNLLDASSIVLKGIVPSGTTPTAIINGSTFEKGEEKEIKLPSGAKTLVKCEEIKEDSVVILINGAQRRELHLRLGL